MFWLTCTWQQPDVCMRNWTFNKACSSATCRNNEKAKKWFTSVIFTEPVPVRQPPHRNHVHKQSEKTTRVRTVLNEKQLHTLRTCYNANPRPDALMKEQLVEMTGLSPRVIRVWFQNKRCKDKKRSILMKQLQQQHHSDKTVWNWSMLYVYVFCRCRDLWLRAHYDHTDMH